MLEDVLKTTYSAKDCAFAIQHGGFSKFRNDLTRNNRLFLPRKASAGPGGGEYRYAHILEMAIHLSIGSARNGHIAKSVMWGLVNRLQGSDYGLKKINAMNQKNRNIILHGGSGFENDDFPEGSPHSTTWVVDFPTVFLNEDFISRDNSIPTYIIYDHSTHKGSAAEVDLIEEMSLGEAQNKFIEMKLSYAADSNMRDEIREQCDEIPILNLTTMLTRIDKRLELRIKAQTMRGA